MARIEKLDDIESVLVHWTESILINDELGCDERDNIEKLVDAVFFDGIIQRAEKTFGLCYDKISLSVKLKNGALWCRKEKFYLYRGDFGLIELLNRNRIPKK